MANLRIKPDGRSVVTYETSSVEIFMDHADMSGRLSNLFSVSRGRGYATRLMELICQWADENDVHLWLIAKPYGTPLGALNPQQLVEFYGRFGFRKSTPRSNEMHRDSKGASNRR